jgi:hypothetical protein
LIDGFVATSGGQPAIVNTNSANLYVANLFARVSGAVIQTTGRTAVAGSGSVDWIQEYSHNDSGAGGDWVPHTAYNVINGAEAQQDPMPQVSLAVGAYPSDLVTRHLPGPLPWITDADVVFATAYGADPTGTVDSTAAIQNAINASREVFLPRGDYVISGTLQLKPETRLFGVAAYRSWIIAPTWDPQDQYQPYIQTADTNSGATYVGDLYLGLDATPNSNAYNTTYAQTYLYGLEWQAGRSSVQNEVAAILGYTVGPDYTTAARKLVHVSNGGGADGTAFRNPRLPGVSGRAIAAFACCSWTPRKPP